MTDKTRTAQEAFGAAQGRFMNFAGQRSAPNLGDISTDLFLIREGLKQMTVGFHNLAAALDEIDTDVKAIKRKLGIP